MRKLPAWPANAPRVNAWNRGGDKQRVESAASRIDTSLVLGALQMALWHRQPGEAVTVHADQGCPFTGHQWQTFQRDHQLAGRMSRRCNFAHRAGRSLRDQFFGRSDVNPGIPLASLLAATHLSNICAADAGGAPPTSDGEVAS